MNKYSRKIISVLLLGAIFYFGSYFKYKSGGLELPGLLYTGLVLLGVLLITASVVILKNKRRL